MVTDRRQAPTPVDPALAYGEEALELAGRALDPNGPGGASLALGQLLLREAFVAAAKVACKDDSLASVEAALDALHRVERPGRTANGHVWDASALIAQSDLVDC